jgi:PAS domain S-box-containing protein
MAKKPPRREVNAVAQRIGQPLIFLILTLCLGLTILGYNELKKWDDRQIQQDLQEIARYRFEAFRNSLISAEETLESVRAFFDSSKNVERSEFKMFVSNLLARYPEFLAIDWLPRVPAAKKTEFENQMHEEGFTDYLIHTTGPDGEIQPVRSQDAYYPVYFSEPIELGRLILGVDPTEDVTQKDVIAQTILTGKAGVTALHHLERLKTGNSLGFKVYLPVYDPDLPFGLQGNKKDTLRGMLRLVLGVERMLDQVMSRLPASDIRFYFFEGRDLTLDHLAYHFPNFGDEKETSEAELHTKLKGLHWEEDVSVADQTWTVVAVPTKAFLQKKRNSVVWILPIMGLILTVILGLFLFSNLERVNKIQRMVDTRTAELMSEVHDRRRAEQSLSETLSLMQAIFESANQSIISTDVSGVIRTFNRAAERMLGYSAEEMIGKETPVILHDAPEVSRYAAKLSKELGFEISSGFETFVAKTRIVGIPDENEWTYIRKDGTRFSVLLSVNPLRDGDGHITGYVGIGYDITERKKIERMKNEFISTVSHELRTPLTSIRGSLGLIAGGLAGQMPPQAKPLIEIAMNNCERLVRLINDILDIEKIESGKMDFRNKPLVLVPLIEQSLLANEAYGRQFGVSFTLTQDVADARIYSDPDRIIQVMTNLLSNAAKFSPEGSTVTVNLARTNGRLRVSVSDQGSGIPAAFREQIFQKFAQADASDARQKSGTGLGLSICKAIVEKLGGTIAFETQLGKGTTFYFELPEFGGVVASGPALAVG